MSGNLRSLNHTLNGSSHTLQGTNALQQRPPAIGPCPAAAASCSALLRALHLLPPHICPNPALNLLLCQPQLRSPAVNLSMPAA